MDLRVKELTKAWEKYSRPERVTQFLCHYDLTQGYQILMTHEQNNAQFLVLCRNALSFEFQVRRSISSV